MTIRNYLGELRYLFSYYPDVAPLDFDSEMVMQYLLYLTKTLGCGRSKCCTAAQSISFFLRHVLQKPYVIPTVIYPRKVKTLPPVMSAEEILKVINAIDNIKHRCILMLLYSTRFGQHILPKRFTKIRTYGYLANRNRQLRINEVLKKMKLPEHKVPVKVPIEVRMMERYGITIHECPSCKAATMKLVHVFYPWKQTDDG